MTREEAKEILLLYRPGLDEDHEFAEALDAARRDPELISWLEQHLATQAALRDKFREISPPASLKARLLSEAKIIRPPAAWWRRPVWLAAAACIALLIGLGSWFGHERKPDHFADFRQRMVETVLRRYGMDTNSSDGEVVRRYLASKGAPADYAIPKGMQQLKVMGGGLLRWRGHPVSMVCFDRGDKEILYFFVLERSATKDAPPDNFALAKVNKLMTASWSNGRQTYVLAAPEDAQSIQRFL